MHPERRSILEINQKCRDGAVPHRNPKFARHMMRIPMEDWYALRRLIPGLNATDPQELTAAWEWFERSPFSEKYRINKITRGIIRNGDLIK